MDLYDDLWDEEADFAQEIPLDFEARLAGGIDDPVREAARTLFGLDYLYPYQRLVVANILEAAQAAGISVNWPRAGGAARPEEPGCPAQAPAGPETPPGGDDSDRASLGRQIVILPTGAGKSLCFQLPAMLLDGPTLVIYPILSLMADQERRLAEKNFAPVVLRGGQSAEERAEIFGRLQRGESRFIIANPEVLLTSKILGLLGRLGIVHVVVDEAHCVSEWGESFRPSYLEIGRIVSACGAPLVTAFTATASSPVLEKIERCVFGPSGSGVRAHRVLANPGRENIYYAARGTLLRDLAVRDLLCANERPALVFCASRVGTEKLARALRSELGEREIRFYHAGLERDEKDAVEKWFFASTCGVLVSTCAYGMGVDKSDIRTVIHRDCPPSVEAYLQESGRAGRDGKSARALLLWGPDDAAALSRARSEAERARLAALLSYARDAATCRREALLGLLNWQGEKETPGFLCCDVCDGVALAEPPEKTALTRFFRRSRRAYTVNEASGLIAARSSWRREHAHAALHSLICDNTLRVIKSHLWKDKLTLSERAKRRRP